MSAVGIAVVQFSHPYTHYWYIIERFTRMSLAGSLRICYMANSLYMGIGVTARKMGDRYTLYVLADWGIIHHFLAAAYYMKVD